MDAPKPTAKPRQPRYYEKGGKIYDAGVEISPAEAENILKRNAVRRAKNEAEVAKGASHDPMLATIMRRAQELANEGFDSDEAELRPILEKRKPKSP